MIRNELKNHLLSAVQAAYPDAQNVQVELSYPKELRFGDFTTNIALTLSRQLQQSPKEIANTIASSMRQSPYVADLYDDIEVAGPGFINLRLSKQALWDELGGYLANSSHQDSPLKGQRIMVEFSSPNIAKPFNVGHLRSTIIGDSLASIYQYLGADVLKDNHLGDWGTQYGKLAYAVEKWGDWDKIEADPISELFRLYVQFHQEEENNPDLAEQGRNYFKRLEQKDPQVTQVWEKLVALSLEDFNQLYRQLGVEFDMQLGESFYEPMLADLINECKSSGIAKESQGALLIFFDNDPELKNTPLMIQKSNGTSTYGTRDLAGVKYRFGKFELDKLVIEIGNDQRHYFKQIITASELMGWVKPGQLVHVGHGLLSLPSGKMSTRKGRTIDIKDLLQELEEKAFEIIKDRESMSPEQKTETARDIAVGALKYNDLSQNRNSDIVFDKQKSLALEGNSAPYLQYIVARSQSILDSAGLTQSEQAIQKLLFQSKSRQSELEPAERDLVAMAIRFDEVVMEAAKNYMPSTLASYLFQLSQLYNSFYHSCPVLQSSDDVRPSRLLLVVLVKQLLERGLGLLGIQAPKRM